MANGDDLFDSVFDAELHERGQLSKYEQSAVDKIIRLMPGWSRKSVESVVMSDPSRSGEISLADLCWLFEWPVVLKTVRAVGIPQLDIQLWKNSSRIKLLESLDNWHEDDDSVFCDYRGIVFQWPRRDKFMVLFESDVGLSRTGFCWVVDSTWPKAYRRVNYYFLQTLKNFVQEISNPA